MFDEGEMDEKNHIQKLKDDLIRVYEKNEHLREENERLREENRTRCAPTGQGLEDVFSAQARGVPHQHYCCPFTATRH